jgi:hypothetical protein
MIAKDALHLVTSTMKFVKPNLLDVIWVCNGTTECYVHLQCECGVMSVN